MPMMSDFEEDPDEFKVKEKRDRAAESLVGAYPTESTDQRTTGSGITTKIPPLLDGSTSWFKYEELINDCLDLTVLEPEKRGPALKNRLVGDAGMHKGLLDREPLRAADGFKYFRNTLRSHFIKRSSESVCVEIFSVHPSKERKHLDGQVVRQVFIDFQELKPGWTCYRCPP